MALKGNSPTRITFDLVRIAQRGFSRTELGDVIPLLNRDNVKLEYGRRAVEEIRRNTRNENKDKEGDKFEGYSSVYKKSFRFRAFNKSGDVNLTLTGAMLSDLRVIGPTRVGVQVGYDRPGSFSERKAHGHITGAGGRLPIRDFLGLPPEQEVSILKEVLRQFSPDEGPGIVVDFQSLVAPRVAAGTQLAATLPPSAVALDDEALDLIAVFSSTGS